MANKIESKPTEHLFYILDTKNPMIIWSIDDQWLQQNTAKFVKIEVVEVTNPDKIPLSFDLHYHVNGDKKVLLGVFSLFPPDNPGTFIVAAGDKLNKVGSSISLTLKPLEVISEQQILRIKIKPYSLIFK